MAGATTNGRADGLIASVRHARHRLRRMGSYGMYRTYRLARLRWRRPAVAHWNPVLVYQMGKVGSTAVTDGLRASSLRRPVLHVHHLNPRDQARVNAFGRAEYRRTRTISPVVLDALYVSRRLEAMKRRERLDVVTIVREPVGRNLSGFFEQLNARHPELAARLATDHPDRQSLCLAREVFVEDSLFDDPFSWFDDELHETTGIDVFGHQFDPDRGYAVCENDRARVLVMRFRDLARTIGPAMTEFLATEDVSLPRRNEARARPTAAAYKSLSSGLRLSADQLARIYGSDRVRHFYSSREIDELVERWSGGLGTA